jgi:putative transposase
VLWRRLAAVLAPSIPLVSKATLANACRVPRANRYFVPGKFYHLTHRCHDRRFLFKFARDRSQYRQLLWSSLREFPVTVLAYCITSNHTHVLARSESDVAISRWMQTVEGEFAQSYNLRKGRRGAFWSDRYHCTMIEEGPHLWNAMVYIDLNMVRAGVVTHPAQWPWCSYREWFGSRRRYGVVDCNESLRVLGGVSLAEFRASYEASVQARLAKDAMAREPHWTESIAVGSRAFVESIAQTVTHRQRLNYSAVGERVWVLREDLLLPARVNSLEARMTG